MWGSSVGKQILNRSFEMVQIITFVRSPRTGMRRVPLCPDVSTRKSPRNTGSTPDQLRITLDHVRPTSGSPDDIGSTGARPDHDRITHVRMFTGECHRSDHRYTSGSRLAFCHVNTCRGSNMPFSSPQPPLSQEHRQTPRFLSPFAPIPKMPSLRPLSH